MAVTVVLGSYESVMAESRPAVSAQMPRGQAGAIQPIESELSKSIKAVNVAAMQFAQINKSIMKSGIPKHMLTDDHLRSLAALMIGIRKIESDLKAAVYPEQLAGQHQLLRRAVAETRSEIVATYDFHRQLLHKPEVLESDIDMDGLRLLAERSTKRLLELTGA